MKFIIPILNRTELSLIITGLFQLFFSHILNAQESTYIRKININRGDTIINAELLNNLKSPKLKSECLYYWYSSSGIHINQGGYSGILLHGQYTEYDKYNNLILKGVLKYGTKSGTWSSWYSNGNIKEINRYEKGLHTGKCIKYDSSGNCIFSGLYHNDKLIKEYKIIPTDKLKKSRSKNGSVEKNQESENEK